MAAESLDDFRYRKVSGQTAREHVMAGDTHGWQRFTNLMTDLSLTKFPAKNRFLGQGCHPGQRSFDPRTDRACAWPLRVDWQKDQICHPAAATPLNEEGFVIA